MEITCHQIHQMPPEHQARGDCDDHYWNVVPLAGQVRAPVEGNRYRQATVLTAQVAAGATLGIAAQIFLVWIIIGHVLPFFGLELLDVARDLAAFNLPVRVGQLFGVGL